MMLSLAKNKLDNINLILNNYASNNFDFSINKQNTQDGMSGELGSFLAQAS